MDNNNCIDKNKFHDIMGHCGVEKLHMIVKIHGFKLTGRVELYCAISKAIKKNVNKERKINNHPKIIFGSTQQDAKDSLKAYRQMKRL
jgi:hypothetical protein